MTERMTGEKLEAYLRSIDARPELHQPDDDEASRPSPFLEHSGSPFHDESFIYEVLRVTSEYISSDEANEVMAESGYSTADIARMVSVVVAQEQGSLAEYGVFSQSIGETIAHLIEKGRKENAE